MPEESIAAYFNNIKAFIIFIVVLAFIFALVFLLSRFLTRKASNNSGNMEIRQEITGVEQKNIMPDYKEDPNQRKNIFILGIIFIIMILFILLVFCVYNFSTNPSISLNLFLIAGIIISLIFIIVYIIRSKIIS
jgi:NADH:ubiquinone oxidoreductase subunit 3 (subunit A)